MSKLYYHKTKGKEEEKIRLHKHEHWNKTDVDAFGNAAVGAIFAVLGTVMTIGSGLAHAWMLGVPVAIFYPTLCLFFAWHFREIHIYE